MVAKIQVKTQVDLGVVPTHIKFVGGLLPDENGRIPRGDDGTLKVVANMTEIQASCPVPMSCIQVPYFPGLNEDDVAEMTDGLRNLGLDVHFILMVGGGDPMNPADEDSVVAVLVDGLNAASRNKIEQVSSTSVELWMQDAKRKEGDEFAAAVAQNVALHTRVYREANLENSTVKMWHIEFLREGEFQTFTNIERSWKFVRSANEALGFQFFKVLVDAAHCGDSPFSIAEHEKFISEIGAANELGIFHASAKTTRGCLSTDDGWIGALLAACAKTGKLDTVFVEVFHHEDEALEALRKLEPGHGVDTTDGRSYDEVIIDGLTDIGRRLNNLAARGALPQLVP